MRQQRNLLEEAVPQGVNGTRENEEAVEDDVDDDMGVAFARMDEHGQRRNEDAQNQLENLLARKRHFVL